MPTKLFEVVLFTEQPVQALHSMCVEYDKMICMWGMRKCRLCHAAPAPLILGLGWIVVAAQ